MMFVRLLLLALPALTLATKKSDSSKYYSEAEVAEKTGAPPATARLQHSGPPPPWWHPEETYNRPLYYPQPGPAPKPAPKSHPYPAPPQSKYAPQPVQPKYPKPGPAYPKPGPVHPNPGPMYPQPGPRYAAPGYVHPQPAPHPGYPGPGRKPRLSGGCLEHCAYVPDGDYQSCRGCNVYVSCVAGLTYDYRPCPAYLCWDDYKKRCEFWSSTCDCKVRGGYGPFKSFY